MQQPLWRMPVYQAFFFDANSGLWKKCLISRPRPLCQWPFTMASISSAISRVTLPFNNFTSPRKGILYMNTIFRSGLTPIDNNLDPFNEIEFGNYVLKIFKNAYPGFYLAIRKMYDSFPTEDIVKLLCERIDLFYASEDPDQMAEALYPLLQKYPDKRTPTNRKKTERVSDYMVGKRTANY